MSTNLISHALNIRQPYLFFLFAIFNRIINEQCKYNIVPVCYIHFLFKKQNKLGQERQSFISAHGVSASNSTLSRNTFSSPVPCSPGRSVVWKTPDTAKYSAYVSTLCKSPFPVPFSPLSPFPIVPLYIIFAASYSPPTENQRLKNSSYLVFPFY
jgi:hypothetical protein